jgi:hypothetical protein
MSDFEGGKLGGRRSHDSASGGNWVEEDNMASWRWPKNTLCTPYNETMMDLYSLFIKVLVTRLYVQYYIKRVYSSTT